MELTKCFGLDVVTFVSKFAALNAWKYKKVGYDRDDIIQECYLIYLDKKSRYEYKPEDEFLKIFKSCVRNFFFDMVYKNNHEKPLNICNAIDDLDIKDLGVGNECSTFYAKYLQAPSEIKELINILLNASPDMLNAMGLGDTTYCQISNKLLCSLIGLDAEEYDLKGTFDAVFSTK